MMITAVVDIAKNMSIVDATINLWMSYLIAAYDMQYS